MKKIEICYQHLGLQKRYLFMNSNLNSDATGVLMYMRILLTAIYLRTYNVYYSFPNSSRETVERKVRRICNSYFSFCRF